MKLSIGNRSYEVESVVESGTLRLSVDGKVHEIPFERLPGGRVRLTLGGTTTLAWSDGRNAVTNGRIREVRRVASAGLPPIASLAPPMPALVTAVLIAAGDSVTKGQKLVLLSAMKTEIAIRSPRDGVVASVRAVVGEQAMPGTDLVALD